MLRELQQAFVAGIYGDEAAITARLAPTPRLDGAQQLDVYRASIFGGLQKALDEVYPVCRQLVGEKFFNHMGWRYIALTPSQHFDLTRYGEELAAFIESEVPTEEVPCLADMARLEWACHRAHYRGEADAALPGQTGANMAVATLQFRLAPHVSLVRSPWPLGELWAAHQPGCHQRLEDIVFDDSERCFIVWREDDVLAIDTVDEPLQVLLRACETGTSAVQLAACLEAAGHGASFAAALGLALSRDWLRAETAPP